MKFGLVFTFLFLSTCVAHIACAQERLVLLSPHWEGIKKEFESGFIKHMRGKHRRSVSLTWLEVGGGTSDIHRYIDSEYRRNPDSIGVDLIFGGGIETYAELKQRGLLSSANVEGETLSGLQRDLNGVPLYDHEMQWFAVALSGFGILYNKRVLEILDLPHPNSWEDMGHRKALSWISLADPRKSGSAHAAYEIILQAYGWERGWRILSSLAANAKSFTSAASQTAKDVASGEAAMAPVIDSYAWSQIEEAGEDLIGYVLPEDLTVITGDLIAKLKGAPSGELADKFINYVLSNDGQRLLMQRAGTPRGPRTYRLAKFSVLPSLYGVLGDAAVVKGNPFSWRSKMRYDLEKASKRWSILNDLIGTVLIDAQYELAERWKGVSSEITYEEALGKLAAPPLPENETLNLADGAWRDPLFRSKTIEEWSRLTRLYAKPSIVGAFLKYFPALAFMGIFFMALVPRKRWT